jgi:leader peptidase (prepilin peptidase)/N-methyltransferase
MALWQIIPLGYLAVVTIPLVRIDWKTHKLPNVWVMPGYLAIAIALIGEWITTGEYPMIPAISAAGYFSFMLLLSFGGGMGMGDVKLAGVLGGTAGLISFPAAILSPVLAFNAGGVAALVVLIATIATRTELPLKQAWAVTKDTKIPFGPFMLLGFWVAMLLPLLFSN